MPRWKLPTCTGLRVLKCGAHAQGQQPTQCGVAGCAGSELAACFWLAHAASTKRPPAKGAADSISSPWNSRASLQQQGKATSNECGWCDTMLHPSASISSSCATQPAMPLLLQCTTLQLHASSTCCQPTNSRPPTSGCLALAKPLLLPCTKHYSIRYNAVQLPLLSATHVCPPTSGCPCCRRCPHPPGAPPAQWRSRSAAAAQPPLQVTPAQWWGRRGLSRCGAGHQP
jgi:hypothetical protein